MLCKRTNKFRNTNSYIIKSVYCLISLFIYLFIYAPGKVFILKIVVKIKKKYGSIFYWTIYMRSCTA